MFVVIVPSRGRPENIRRLYEAWDDTVELESTVLIVAVDTDDPLLSEYIELPHTERLWIGPRLRMAGTLNKVAVKTCELPTVRWVGFLGDDHSPQTVGWDVKIVEELKDLEAQRGFGIVYGNDLLQREALPTAVFMTADIVRALGWMAPPSLTHLYLDSFWLELGQQTSCIKYLPDVIIEHCHPLAGKAPWDSGYDDVNSGEMYQKDAQAFEEWKNNHATSDVSKVMSIRASP